MQAVAREMNLSETTFIERRDVATEREQGVRVRIFTTAEELPLAGHPTLGTSAILARIAPEIVAEGWLALDLNAGRIPVQLGPAPHGADAVYGQMQQLDPVFGEQHNPAEIAALLGLAMDDLLLGQAIETVSKGTAFVLVALRSVEALGRMRVDVTALKEYRAKHDCRFLYAVAPTGNAEVPWRARMQFYGG
jgi:trans-2,3-dihydro-3-hydroxyanthranilate isomerase